MDGDISEEKTEAAFKAINELRKEAEDVVTALKCSGGTQNRRWL
ncbi:hypothetical protein [Pontiella desulfatans]|nr:hypothetical protein [Pontiella desulfatans]